MSVLDFLKEHDEEYMTGFYYAYKPDPTHSIEQKQEEGAKVFRYSKAEGRRRIFDNVLVNMRSDTERYVIKTCDDCGFKIGGYVSTQNGLFWTVEDITCEEQTKGNEETLTMWRRAIKTEFILRLRRVDNPWGIGV